MSNDKNLRWLNAVPVLDEHGAVKEPATLPHTELTAAEFQALLQWVDAGGRIKGAEHVAEAVSGVSLASAAYEAVEELREAAADYGAA